MTDDEIQDDNVMNGISYFVTIFCILLVKSLIQLCNLRDMMSYRPNGNEAVLLVSRLLIVVCHFIVCTCKKMATKRPNVA